MRNVLIAVALLALTSCGGGGSDDGSAYYIRVEGSQFDTHELSDLDYAKLLEEPIVNVNDDGSGQVTVRLGHGDWITDYIDELYTGEMLPLVTIISGDHDADDHVLELSRDEYQNVIISQEIIHGGAAEEYIEYVFTFEAITESEEDIDHVLETDEEEDDLFFRNFQTTRYLHFGRESNTADNLSGSTRFPAVALQEYLPNSDKPNDLVKLGSYTIFLYPESNQNAGFKVDMVGDSVFQNVIFASSLGQVVPFSTIYQVDTGRPARLQMMYRLKDVLIENPSLVSGSSSYNGEELLTATLTPIQFEAISLEYNRVGTFNGTKINCLNIENGPQPCQ